MPAAADLPSYKTRLQALDSAQALVRRQDGIITFWSRGMERLYGYCAAAALGRNAHHLLKTEFPSLLERIEAELKERGEWTGELLQLRHDGETVIVASQWSLWRGNGHIAVTEVYNDLTASKRAEQGLIAREAHLKSILETVPDAMIVIDERGAIRSFSDKVQIQQVLLNLMRNAMEAMEHSERREILLSTTAAADDLLMVNVADSGPGIDDALASQLFRPFVTTKPHGMGVGLSISRTIVEAHGGRIWVEPNPGGGAAFRFTLHLVPEQDLADA